MLWKMSSLVTTWRLSDAAVRSIDKDLWRGRAQAHEAAMVAECREYQALSKELCKEHRAMVQVRPPYLNAWVTARLINHK